MIFFQNIDNLFKSSYAHKNRHKPVFEINTVRGRGLEPPRITPLVPKTSAATNYATRAHCSLFTNTRDDALVI
jgi:hypothetical protein